MSHTLASQLASTPYVRPSTGVPYLALFEVVGQQYDDDDGNDVSVCCLTPRATSLVYFSYVFPEGGIRSDRMAVKFSCLSLW